MSTPTDDLEAMAREWYADNWVRVSDECVARGTNPAIGVLIAFARSLAHPPAMEAEQQRAALAWMRAQIKPFIPDADGTESARFCAGVLSDKLTHPPSSELVSAGNAMNTAINRYRRTEPNTTENILAYGDLVKAQIAWNAALAHPKEVAPTAEKIMEVVAEWLWASVPDNQHIRHPLGSKYRTDQPAQDALRARLKTLFP